MFTRKALTGNLYKLMNVSPKKTTYGVYITRQRWTHAQGNPLHLKEIFFLRSISPSDSTLYALDDSREHQPPRTREQKDVQCGEKTGGEGGGGGCESDGGERETAWKIS